MRQQLLTITVLLLSLSIHTSGQSRIQGFKDWNPKQTLEGLRDIGLVVKYGQVDGLPEVMRPAMLQMMQDRARDLLRLGEVPILKSTDEANIVARPRLVFTITMNKQTDPPPAISVELKLYERVRLLRDPAKELELATLSASVAGPKATNEKLFALFEQHVNAFVRAYREMNSNPPRLGSRSAALPGQLKDNANPLQGLNGIDSNVSLVRSTINGLRSELLISDEHHRALANRLPREVESKLKQAGIPFWRFNNDGERAGWPLLRVTISLRPPNSYDPETEIRCELWQQVRTVRDSRKLYAVTWESRATDGPITTDEALLRIVNEQLDEFIKAYHTANAQLSSAPK